MTRKPVPMTTCETCGRTAPSARKHPCRFERACACWYGVPCEPVGALYGTMTRAPKVAAFPLAHDLAW